MYLMNTTLLEFREITLNDKALFDALFLKMQPQISDFTFTNLFMWQKAYGLKIAYDEELDYWYLLARPSEGFFSFFFPPLGDWNDDEKLHQAVEKMHEYAHENNFEVLFYRAPLNFCEALEKIFPHYRCEIDRNVADYVYLMTDLRDFSGRKMHAKKNHLNRFQKSYNWQYETIDSAVAAEILQLRESWFDLNKTDENGRIPGESRAMRLIFENYEQLNLFGGIIRVEGKIIALTVGEKLNSETMVVHIEKANTEFDGVYAAINNFFINKEAATFQNINREEDLGLEGLRKAKLSYNPDHMVDKYRILIKP